MFKRQMDLLNGKLKMENGKLNTLKIFNFQLSIFNSRVAFTLAEVLITLAIIGVVAAITMPVLMTNINERVNSERQANIVYKVTQAMEHMRALGKLTAYDSTESFVDELQKHLKVAKRCDSEHIAECWPTETVINGDGEEFSVADAKTGANLGFDRTTDTNNVGLILADGASLILNYDVTNPKRAYDIGDKITAKSKSLPVGNNKSKVFEYTTDVTSPISFVMDVNGKRGPNKEMIDNKYYDIRSFNGATFKESGPLIECYNNVCIHFVDSYSPVNCADSDSEGYSFCGPHISGFTEDYWAGAKYKCDSLNMALPTINQLKAINPNKTHYPSIMSNLGWSWYWSSEDSLGYDNPETISILVGFFADGSEYDNMINTAYKTDHNCVFCIQN